MKRLRGKRWACFAIKIKKRAALRPNVLWLDEGVSEARKNQLAHSRAGKSKSLNLNLLKNYELLTATEVRKSKR